MDEKSDFLSFTKDDWRKVLNKKFPVLKCGVAKSSFWRIFEKYLMVRSRNLDKKHFFEKMQIKILLFYTSNNA